MKTHLHLKVGIGALLPTMLAALSLGTAKADPNEVTLTSCPAAVQAVITSHQKSGRLEEIKTITSEGRKLYLADFELAGRQDLKLYIAEDGSVVTTREDLALAKAPAVVKAAAERLVPAGGKVEDVEKDVTNGKTTYLVEIDVANGKDIKAVLAEDGTVISQRTD
ncbi:putative membrane protein YkoI [Roseimicrobium gellanilyticum]|uniref:Putative membrane protein YkoI n=1 Tax=Roseimicrobium gellanilyticum TaxID=748857 RepID=A0A366HQH6_9BACT|nr:hypothetical protein [Roseimicrobium gellanilyticum]RBP45925.1 putative membrane protein YkoI [Roseimicrobium gellanilyticum]